MPSQSEAAPRERHALSVRSGSPGAACPLSHGYAVPAPPKGEPTHLRGQMQLMVELLASSDSAGAEGRAAIASPFGRGVSASR